MKLPTSHPHHAEFPALLWLDEFGPGYNVPQIVSDALIDISWHNDTHPSFIQPGTEDFTDHPRLWVDHPNPAEREDDDPTRPRYAVWDHRAQVLLCETDDVVLAMAALKTAAAAFLAIHPYATVRATWMHLTPWGNYPVCDDCHVRGHAPCDPPTNYTLLPWAEKYVCACEHATHLDQKETK